MALRGHPICEWATFSDQQITSADIEDSLQPVIYGPFTDLKDQILRHLQNTEKEKLQLAFAANLRKSAVIEDFLTPPVKPSAK